MFCNNAYYRYGLSGTALRRDLLSNMKAMAVLGPSILRLPATELMARGYLSGIDLKMIPVGVVHSPEHSLTWQEEYEELIVRSHPRNLEIVRHATEALRSGDKVMILVRHIEHGEILKKMFDELKVPSVFLQGQDSSSERISTRNEFEEKGAFVLIASPIYDEGVDLPEVNMLIIAAGGKSEVKTIQKVGRGLRPKKGGSVLHVLDFMDVGKYTKKHSAERRKIYEKEGYLSKEKK